LPNPARGSTACGWSAAAGCWFTTTRRRRQRLAASLSADEGRTWKWTRHLEDHPEGSYHYLAVIQRRDGTIHVVYSYFVAAGKSMKHADFNEAWLQEGAPGAD
jgi:predicted neuraminidase